MEFISFDLAKKLKEKGLSCKYPLAMYNERGSFCPLFTSADRNPNIKCVLGSREYYDYDDFDEKDFIAPTIEQVLEWLRKEKNIHINPVLWHQGWYVNIQVFAEEEDEDGVCLEVDNVFQSPDYESYEEAALAGVNYCLENLI